jgi:cell division protein ZapA (FtsZ GTPase activity inhibitor)
MMASELCLDILGTSFTITADEDESYLQKVLDQYRTAVDNTQSISGINEPLNVAILTGFLLCDEVNKIRRQLEEFSGKVGSVDLGGRRIIKKKNANLDNALKICGNEQPL